MADIKGWNIAGIPYNVKDEVARAAIDALQSSVAPVYNALLPYTAGDYVLYEGKLYKFTANHAAGAWDASHVAEAQLADIYDEFEDYLPLAGGELTGDITAPTFKNSSSIDLSGTPGSTVFASGLRLNDSSANMIAAFQAYQDTSNKLNVRMYQKRTVNASDVTHYLALGIAANGEKSVELNNNAWLNAIFPNSYNPPVAGLNPETLNFDVQRETSSGFVGGKVSVPLPTAYGGTGGIDTGWNSLTNSSAFTGTIYWRQLGALVCVMGYQVKLKTDMTGSNITLSSSALPASVTTAAFPAGNIDGFGQIQVNTSGNIIFYKQSGSIWLSTRNINFCGTYMTAIVPTI